MPDPRDAELLDAAMRVFLRFGYRKASMDEIARHAGISRQGLYLHFKSKPALFVAAVRHTLDSALQQAQQALATDAPIEARVVAACDAVHGLLVEHHGDSGQVAELVEAGQRLLGTMVDDFGEAFVEALARALDDAGVAERWDHPATTARQLAETIDATSVGFKHKTRSRAAWRSHLQAAVHLLCRSEA